MNKKRQMTLKQPLSELFSVSGRFRRSVHIERDNLEPDSLSGYRITPVALKSLRRVLWGVESSGSGSRAWSLTGPYGSGKSSFAIFLASLIGADDTTAGKRARRQARLLLRDAGGSVASEFLGDSGKKRLPSLFPVLITGERACLSDLLLRGLATGLSNIRGKKGQHKRVLSLRKKLSKLLGKDRVPTSAVVKCFDEARRYLVEARVARGLLVVVDEAGKVLEYAAQNPTGIDVLLLQELAELADRSGESPFVLITVFHQSFAGYGARLGPTQRNEWEKVQGRFEDIAFVEGWEQTLRLLGEALIQGNTEPDLISRTQRRVSKALGSVMLPATLEPEKAEALLQKCLPLHPYVALLLGPLFRTGVFQNERSLFAFLASQEPSGLQDFIASEFTGKAIPLFPLARLFDYVDYVLQSRVSFSRPHALRVAEVALQRVPDVAGTLGTQLIKSIALLTWIGEKVGLRADLVTLQESVPRSSKREVSKCLNDLSKASIVTFRKFRSSYIIWEGSDIAIDEIISDAKRIHLSNEQAAAMLNVLSPLDPIVARRHLFTRGTLRYFEVRFVAANHLEKALESEDFGEADGRINIVIYESDQEKRKVVGLIEDRLRVEAAHPWPVLSVLPKTPLTLHTLLSEYAALEHVVRDEPRLPHDPVAKREVDARKRGVEELLKQEISALLGYGGEGTASWFYRGSEVTVADARALTSVLSDVCDEVFHRGPIIHNELVNRSVLSSSAASARRNLLAAMIANPDAEEFGITGYPPEKSMYLTLFGKPHCLHGKDKGGSWKLVEPAKTSSVGSIGPAWHSLQEYLASRAGERFPLEELYLLLQSPPYGIKLGVIPIVVVHFLALRGESFALYENDAFIPSVTTAVIERLLKSPRNFHAQWYPLTSARRDVLRALGEKLEIKPRPGKAVPSVLQVVKHLVRATVDLPKYSKLTRRLNEDAISLRNALSQAKEPAPLIFRQLPEALGMSGFHSDDAKAEGAEAFARRVNSALEDLKRCYEGLLKGIEGALAHEFGLSDLSGDALKNELGARGARLFRHANDPKLRAFLLRLVDADIPLEEWLVSVGTLFAKKPPEHWSDPDYDRFTKELVSVRHSFRELEALVLADEELSKKAEDSRSPRKLFRIAVAELGEPVRERVVSLSPAQEALARNLRREIFKIIKGASGSLTTDARLATLSSLASDLIHEAERNAGTQNSNRKEL